MNILRIREALPTEMPLIMSSWKLTSIRSAFGSRFPKWEHLTIMNAILPGVLDRARTLVACPGDDDDIVLGWLSYTLMDDRPTMVYGFVKTPFRHMRIFKRLIEHAGVDQFCVSPTKVLAFGRRP